MNEMFHRSAPAGKFDPGPMDDQNDLPLQTFADIILASPGFPQPQVWP